MALTTRDATLPAVYSQALDSVSLDPLWTPADERTRPRTIQRLEKRRP